MSLIKVVVTATSLWESRLQGLSPILPNEHREYATPELEALARAWLEGMAAVDTADLAIMELAREEGWKEEEEDE